MFTANDPDAVRRMYNSDEALRIRQATHDQYSEAKIDFAAWALGCVKWRGDECASALVPGLEYWKLQDLSVRSNSNNPSLALRVPLVSVDS